MSDRCDRLYSIAESQQGFFTAGHALACGYPASSRTYHLKTGTWRRDREIRREKMRQRGFL